MPTWFAWLMAGLIVLPLSAQASGPLEERVRVNVVEVPVTVADRDGNPVRGLDRDDFTVLDDGREVELTFFEVVDRDTFSGDSGSIPRDVHPVAKRHFILLFDLTNSLPGTIARVREAAQTFVRDDLDAIDVAAVVTYSVEHGFRFVTSFTSNRDLLVDAIETLGHPKYFRSADPLLLSATEPGPGMTSTSPPGNRGVMDAEIVALFQDLQRRMTQLDSEYRRSRLEASLDGLGELARLLDGVKGTKQVILLSEGFDARLIHGRDGSISESAQETDAVLSGEVWKADFDSRYGFASAKKHLDQMAELFRRSDVILHAIDIKGLRSDVDPRTGYARSSTESLFLMAEPTGGEVFKNANDMSDNFERLVRRQEVTYVLGFQSLHAGSPGSFHRLEVRLREADRGTRVRHRAGYYETAPASELEQTLTTADIVLNDIGRDDVEVETLVVPFPAADERSLTVVITEIDGETLSHFSDSGEVNADLFVYAFDETNAVVDFRHQNIVLEMGKIGEVVRRSGLKYYGALRLPPGDYAVKTVLRIRDSGSFGFERDDVRVPVASDRAILPPLLFEPEGRWVMVKGEARTREELPYPFHVSDESFVPAVAPQLVPDGTYRLALFAYNLDFMEEMIRAGIRGLAGAAGTERLDVVGHQPQDGGQPGKLLLSLDTKGLAPGVYHLDVAVGQDSTLVTLPFTVTQPPEDSEEAPNSSGGTR